MENFDVILNNAIKRCEGMIIYDDAFKKNFDNIYPFTTENIAGYINKFDLKNKSLLTVGSSGDQVLNAILSGCKDITVLDINPYTKFYYYLKVATILNVDIEEFLIFLRFKDFPEVFKDNRNVFNKKTYGKIRYTLRMLDYESYLFWDNLFQNFDPTDIRNHLFSSDEGRNEEVVGSNLYLQNTITYQETKNRIKKVLPEFINRDIFKVNFDDQFDNIWLSNIGTYLSRHFVKIMVDKYSELLKNDGKLLISYLYDTTSDTKYENGWSSIYNLDETFDILKEHLPILETFIGVKGLKFEKENIKDSILVYYKH